MARIKENFGSHAQTAHVWAQGEYGHGHASDRRMMFDNGVIYSYGRHFAIAKHVQTLEGRNAILFTSAKYSVSTSKHIGHVRNAIRGDAPLFFVQNPDGSTDANIRAFDEKVTSLLADYAKPRIRQTTRDSIAGEIANTIARRNGYGLSFIKKYKALDVPDDINALAEKLQKDRVAKAKREAKERAAAIEAELKHAEQFTQTKRTEWAEFWRLNSDDILRSSMVSGVCSRYVRETHGILLRFINAGKDIQTSAGAEFPASHAKKIFPFLERLKAAGETYDRGNSMKALRLGSFAIDTFDKEGNVKAGCHTVKWLEIVLMAERMGLKSIT
jgi:hypothetical protein